ncbi:TPA: hypothetical protein QDB01_000977 [Burkholderia vietnamiensis]|nr:hypothetical protein [Burkholderia vietnamiensis]
MKSTEYTHDHMVLALKRMFPQLVSGADYRTAHPVGQDGKQSGPPFIVHWVSESVPQPKDSEVDAFFSSNEESIRAEHVRLFRDMALRGSDSRTVAPPDAPDSVKELVKQWTEYRELLRDIPNQPGFPFEVDWPEAPTD